MYTYEKYAKLWPDVNIIYHLRVTWIVKLICFKSPLNISEIGPMVLNKWTQVKREQV